jgi:excisionase family DNA binding protein
VKLLSPKDVADRLDLKPRTVQAMMRDGRLPCYPVVGEYRKRYRMSEQQLQDYLDGRWQKPVEPEKAKPRVERAGFPMLEKFGYR